MRRSRRTAAIAGWLALACLPPVHAWGSNGHRVVGRVAEHHLSEAAARAVVAILGAETLAQAATWPDEIRSDPAWDRAKPWHFVDIDDDATYATTEKSPAGDVVEAIRRFTAVLCDSQADRPSRVQALRFLVHFVGDVHQPLHVGRHADAGGNAITVSWFGAHSNLHSVWDDGLLDSEKLSFSELASFLDHPTPEEVAAWQGAGELDWVAESKAARGQVYAIGDGKLSYEYAYRNLPLVHRRLVQAGVRLAGLLNAIFVDPAPSLPDRPAFVPRPVPPPAPVPPSGSAPP